MNILNSFLVFLCKNSKLKYYVLNYIRLFLPNVFYQKRLQTFLGKSKKYDLNYITKRVDYYNQLSKPYVLDKDYKTLADFKFIKKSKAYFFDTTLYTRYFNSNQRFSYLFGDVTTIPNSPSIVKSRPISTLNENSILLKLNAVRHFIFVKDLKPYTKKMNKVVWRGNVWKTQPQRIAFLEKYYNHTYCNVGHVNNNRMSKHWPAKKISIANQLQYKFVMCIEGNDVATNLKWVMSSNSIAVMPTPKYETWFMEGTLIPDVHYVLVNDDYSNLIEKIDYYIANPDKAQEIIKNANTFVSQFKNKKREKLISLMVLDKYFKLQKH